MVKVMYEMKKAYNLHGQREVGFLYEKFVGKQFVNQIET